MKPYQVEKFSSLHFFKEPTFNLAIEILLNNEVEFETSGHEFTLNFYSKTELIYALSALSMSQIWPYKSFHGGADFEVIS